MQIGIMNDPTEDLFEQIQWLGEHEFDFLDLNLAAQASQPGDFKLSKIAQALADHNLGVVIHVPHYVPAASPLESLRREVSRELGGYLEVASELGSKVLSVQYNLPARHIHVDQIIQWHLDTLGPVCQQAEKLGVTVTIENSSYGGRHQLINIDTLLSRISSLCVQLSSGHARLEYDYDRFDDYVRRFGTRIRHIHLSENDGTADQHLPIGATARSRIDWPRNIRLLRRSGYDGTITLKVFSPEQDYILLSQTLLRRWWDAAA
jgi:sugar phosphate isomerase/epimerase